MSSYVNCLGGRCPHMPFFIGGHMSGGWGGCPTHFWLMTVSVVIKLVIGYIPLSS